MARIAHVVVPVACYVGRSLARRDHKRKLKIPKIKCGIPRIPNYEGKEGRRVAIYLSKILSNEKNVEIVRYFRIKGLTVSEALKGVEARIKRDVNFQKEIKVLKEKLVIEQ